MPNLTLFAQRGRPYAFSLIFLAIAAYLPLAHLVIAPGSAFHLSLFLINLIGQIVCFAMLALALDFVWGLLGILSLGHGVFFGIGGYVMGFYLLNAAYGDTQVLPDFMLFMGWDKFPAVLEMFAHLPVAVFLAIVMAVAVAAVFGYATFRSRINGVYFSIITQALTYALMLLLFNNDLGLGGNNGLTGFTSVAGLPLAQASTQVWLACASCLVFAAAYLLLRSIADSSLGQAMVGVRDDEPRLRFLGYAAYPLSYRQLEEMMQERGVFVDHSSINRWAIRFLPALEKVFRKYKRPVGVSWRMDETYIKVKGIWKYLYRSVEKEGKTVDFLLTAKRDKAAAMRFFDKAMQANDVPDKVTKPMLNFKSLQLARCVLAGIELMHIIRKGQLRLEGCNEMSFAEQVYALAGRIRPV